MNSRTLFDGRINRGVAARSDCATIEIVIAESLQFLLAIAVIGLDASYCTQHFAARLQGCAANHSADSLLDVPGKLLHLSFDLKLVHVKRHCVFRR